MPLAVEGVAGIHKGSSANESRMRDLAYVPDRNPNAGHPVNPSGPGMWSSQ
jgi:hypothetical protein